MIVNGIIAEYNPFHNGHEYHLKEALRLTGADYTVIAMSGDFVQRGAPALLDKHTRAEMALRCGADLVLEIPVLYAVSSAEYFAAGAVSLLDKLGVITHLCFGSEYREDGNGKGASFLDTASFLIEEPASYRAALKELLRRGYTYPNARAEALVQYYPALESRKAILSSPNNILGLEYCKAILKRESNMIPVAINRLGAGYHDSGTSLQLCSAHAIRRFLYAGNSPESLQPHMPEEAARLLAARLANRPPMRSDAFSTALYYKLLMEKSSGYEKYLDVSEDLSNRIQNLLGNFTGFGAFCDLLKTRDRTYTRISRCLLHILLDLRKEHMESGKELDYTPYARVLGFRRSAVPLLGAIKAHSSIPLVTKLKGAERNLDTDACRFFKQDIRCGELYQGVSAIQSGHAVLSEYAMPPVIL